MVKKRKKRVDRKHIVYSIKKGRLLYIGVTYVEKGAIYKSLARRWRKHVHRAMTEKKSWKLCEAIRKYGKEAFEVSIIGVIRGKAPAHEAERALIRKLKPNLNTDVR